MEGSPGLSYFCVVSLQNLICHPRGQQQVEAESIQLIRYFISSLPFR